MSTTITTHTGDTAIILSEAELEPYVTHAETRRWLTGPGLPYDSGVLSFAELCREDREGREGRDGREVLRTVAEATGDAGGRLAAELRDQLVIGGLLGPGGLEAESVLLDGATGEISTTYFMYDRPDLMDRRALAPSLRTLVRFAGATDELAGLRGQFASYVGRYGPKAVAEASQHLLAVFEDGTDGEPAPFWKMAALIRPLALVAGRAGASGLALDLPSRLLDQEFGQGKVVRFEEVDFPAMLAHEPTRRFLREVGLPENGFLFTLDTDVPLQTLAEYYADEEWAAELPAGAGRLIRLGHLVEDNSLVIDGETGAVLNWSEPEARLFPLNTDVSTLAFTLWLLHREQAIDEESGHELTTPDTYDQLAITMLQVLSAVDPTGTRADDGRHYWTEVFQDEASGVFESVGGAW
ncbi:SUKH-4 family immunity protein [Streptomyces sp. NPDC008086]|uniref:SUKH-4 family immunity protein n=1 Tax=Streptomyces sp. NPDC008086 TaxID=3364807 RepID=UPI0036EED1A2